MNLKDLFAEYYKRARFYINNIFQREFAIGFNEKIEKRHLAFFTEEELRSFLIKEVPFYISHSLAYYERPSAEMKEKGLIKADMAFDLDIKTPGMEALNKLKEEVAILIDMLKEDFGAKDLLIAFSGHRGFHVYVRDEVFQALKSDERKAIVEYVTGRGFDYALLFYQEGNKIIGPKPTENGYRGRFARKTIEMLNDKNFSKHFGKTNEEIEAFKEGITKGLWSKTKKRNVIKNLKLISDLITIKESHLDLPVSYDLTRLMRLVNSLHGSTGFIVLPIKSIDKFSIEKAYAFSDEKVKVKILVDIAKEDLVDLKDLKKDEIKLLPLYAAVYLVCQKKAVFV